jgi:hypothetical protein
MQRNLSCNTLNKLRMVRYSARKQRTSSHKRAEATTRGCVPLVHVCDEPQAPARESSGPGRSGTDRPDFFPLQNAIMRKEITRCYTRHPRHSRCFLHRPAGPGGFDAACLTRYEAIARRLVHNGALDCHTALLDQLQGVRYDGDKLVKSSESMRNPICRPLEIDMQVPLGCALPTAKLVQPHGIRIHFDALPAIKIFDSFMPLRPGTDLKPFKNLSQIHKYT